MASILATGVVVGSHTIADVPPDLARSTDQVSQRTYLAAKNALDSYQGDRSRIGLIAGVDYGVYPTVAACLQRMVTEGYRHASPQEFILSTPNIAASVASVRLGLRGPTTNICCGSLSSLVAIGLASEFIEHGRAAALLAGGASSVLDPIPTLSRTYLRQRPVEAAAFILLAREGSSIEVTRFTQRRLRQGGMADLIRETLEGHEIDGAIVHPGSENRIDGLPPVPTEDLRDLAGESLDAAGALAVIEASARVRRGARGILIAFRDVGGHDGAALVVRRT